MGKQKPKKPSPKKPSTKKSSPSKASIEKLKQTLPNSGDELQGALLVSAISTPSANAQAIITSESLAIDHVFDSAAATNSLVSDLKDKTAKVAKVTDPESTIATVKIAAANSESQKKLGSVGPAAANPNLINTSAKVTKVTDPVIPKTVPASNGGSWCDLVKGQGKPLKKKGESFILPSGESCVKIPNSVIERNRKSWDSFILGQFYSDPPAQGTIHSIVNGIWSRLHRDITVSKMEGNSFLFKIPNVNTRNRVLNQRLWQIEGQTMFVAKWEPGITPSKPELSSAPIWLELRNVPLQFFHEEGLEHIAGLVGDPKFLHPSTANKSNLEVAKVFTIIDPRKPLPEGVNVQFDSGEIKRVEVSSPWMPPVCGHCREIGHSIKRCKSAPITCSVCNSTAHAFDQCPRAKAKGNKKKNRLLRVENKAKSDEIVSKVGVEEIHAEVIVKDIVAPVGTIVQNSPPTKDILKKDGNQLVIGETSANHEIAHAHKSLQEMKNETKGKGNVSDSESEVEDDSSDISSSSDEEGQIQEEKDVFVKVLSKRQKKNARGKGPKPQ